jgi:hypothetical protein
LVISLSPKMLITIIVGAVSAVPAAAELPGPLRGLHGGPSRQLGRQGGLPLPAQAQPGQHVRGFRMSSLQYTSAFLQLIKDCAGILVQSKGALGTE